MLFGNISYDIGAILILSIILVWYLIEKRIPLKSYQAYVVLVLTVFTACVFEIITEIMAKNGYQSISFMIALSLLIMVLHTITLVILWYISTLANVKINKYYLILVEAVTVLVSLSNPFTKWSIEYSSQGYIFHWGSYLMFLFDIVNVLVCLTISCKLLNEITVVRFGVLVVSILFCWVGLFIQIIMQENMMVFLMAITCLSLYQYLLNPSSMTDAITGLFSKKFMKIYIENQFLETKNFEVVVIAMDDFKFINRTYGISSGDELLKCMGEFITSTGEDKVSFRMGEDQFSVVFKKKKDSEVFVEKLEERLKQSWDTDKHSGIKMSATICCISCPQDASNYEELVDIMDYSIEISKTTNKGQVCKVNSLALDKQHEQKDIENAVKRAMDNDEIKVYYQPIFSVEKGCYNSAEALVRLHTETLGWISPEIFIPIAEKNGLISRLGEMVLEKVCCFIRDYDIEHSTIEYIEVNISTVQIAREDFVKQVKQIFERYQVKPSQINMEITETATISSYKMVTDNIAQLSEYGIKFSLDDYGSGNANIEYINQMPFSIIKLDKYIVWEAFKSEKARITLEYTVAMLKALQLHIVAEGIETEDMKEQLSKMGCDYMQGWYYSKAVPDEEFVKEINILR